METLHVGIVGAGWMGVMHAEGWQANAPRAEIAAVADVTPSRAQFIGDRFTNGRARAYGTLEDLLADPAIEAVDICLPHHLHADAIILAARAGKAILCEKPLCTSLEDAARIRDVLRETGVTFMAAHNQLFVPSVVEARRLIGDGTLGPVYVIRSIEVGQNRMFSTGRLPVEIGAGESSFAWRADVARSGGGEVLDTGYHGTYRLLALANERPVEVTAMMHRYFVKQLSAEDTGFLLVRFESGAIGEILTSWAFGLASGWSFEVAGEHGSLAGNASRLIHQPHGSWMQPSERTNPKMNTWSLEIAHFLDAVQRGEPVLPSFDQAARVLQVIKAAYRAAEEGRTVKLPEDPTRLE